MFSAYQFNGDKNMSATPKSSKKAATKKVVAVKKSASVKKSAPVKKSASVKKSTAVKKTAVAKKSVTKKKAETTNKKVHSQVSPRERYEMVATMAFYRAEKRNFEPGHDYQDWLECEVIVDKMLGK